jgi:hypothetical protein
MEENVFRTKTGFCHLFPDKIVLTRDGVVGNLSNAVVGSNISRILFIYALIAVGSILYAYNAFTNHQIASAIFFIIIGGYLIFGIIFSLNNSAAPIIERDKIKTTKFKKGVPGLTRSRFVVIFEDEKGKLKKRLIMLPGTLTGGLKESKNAVKIMQQEGFIGNR